MDKTEIINRIGYMRVKANLTQKALSGLIEMNQSYINRLESKKDFLPSLDVLLRIIDACKSTPEEFFYEDLPNYDKDKLLVKKIKNLSVQQIDNLIKYDTEIVDILKKLSEIYQKIMPAD